ncbi:MAG: hypothetical protein ACREQ5_06880, partial [Candidatus Dormibacteria bacterium]
PYASSPSYAAQLFFGIPYTAVQILFHPDDTKSDRLHDYATADDVAAAIRRYVAGRAREAAVGKQAVPSPETVNVTD